MLSDGVAFCRAGAGAPVVLLHGVGLRAECWLPQIRVLQRTHRVFAADLPGHGESACLSSSRPVLADFVDKIGAFVKSAVRSPAVFVGHSAGALLAFSLAARFPELCRGVAALNAVYRRCPAARAAVRARAKLLQKFAHLPKTESGKSGAGVELSPKRALNNANAESEYAANVETTLRRWFGENPAGCGEKTAAQCRLWLNSADCRGYAALYRVFAEEDGPEDGALSALRIPALFLTGAQDTNSTPEMAAAMANLAPRGRAVVIDGAGHLAQMTHSAEVNAALRTFLGECGE